MKVHEKCSVLKLFECVATEMGHQNVEDLMFDCTKINVANNIQDKFYDYYIDLITSEDVRETEHSARVATTMMLALCGPKVDVALSDDEVEVFEGFIC